MTLISVSGLDGAGKSTLIDWLRTELRARRRDVTVLHQNDHVGLFPLLRRWRDRVVHGGPAPETPPRLAPRPTRLGRLRDALIWSAPVRTALYPLDLLAFLAIRTWVERIRGRVLVMDRYFYDTLVDIAVRRQRPPAALFLRITPRPDVAVLLDVDAREAFARKREYSVEYLERRAVAYRALFPRLTGGVRIASGAPDETRRRMSTILEERLA